MLDRIQLIRFFFEVAIINPEITNGKWHDYSIELYIVILELKTIFFTNYDIKEPIIDRRYSLVTIHKQKTMESQNGLGSKEMILN